MMGSRFEVVATVDGVVLEMFADQAAQFAAATQLLKNNAGNCLAGGHPLWKITEDLLCMIQRSAKELGIVPPGAEPETTTKGAPVTEVAVDAEESG